MTTFAPFALEDARGTEYKDVRLQFNDWDWLDEKYGEEVVEQYGLNGHELADIVELIISLNKLPIAAEAFDNNSEGDTCYFHFNRLEDAVMVAELCSDIIQDKARFLAVLKTCESNRSCLVRDQDEDDE